MRLNVDEAKRIEIEPVDKRVDSPHRVVLSNVVFQTLRQQRDLGSLLAFDESPHARPIDLDNLNIVSKGRSSMNTFSHGLDPKRPSNATKTGRSAVCA